MTNSNKKLIHEHGLLMKEKHRFKAENDLFYSIVENSSHVTLEHISKGIKLISWEVDLDERIEKMEKKLRDNNIALGVPMSDNSLEKWLLNLGFKTITPLTPRLCTAISCYYDSCDYHTIDDAEPYPEKEYASAVIHRLRSNGYSMLYLSDEYLMNHFYEDLVDACYYYSCVEENESKASYEEINEKRKIYAKFGDAFLNSIVVEVDEEDVAREDAVYAEVRKVLINEGFLLNNENNGFITMPLCSENAKIMCIKDGADFEVVFVVGFPHIEIYDRFSKDKDKINKLLKYPVVWYEPMKTVGTKFNENEKNLIFNLANAIKDMYQQFRPEMHNIFRENFKIIK